MNEIEVVLTLAVLNTGFVTLLFCSAAGLFFPVDE